MASPGVLAEVNGRKMGLPYIEQAAQNDKVLTWIRQDWLDAVGMSAPTTVEELHAVATAFVEADMGQGGDGTTLGIDCQQPAEHLVLPRWIPFLALGA